MNSAFRPVHCIVWFEIAGCYPDLLIECVFGWAQSDDLQLVTVAGCMASCAWPVMSDCGCAGGGRRIGVGGGG